MSEVTLQISIAGKNYPLSVKASEEATIRKAELQLEEAVSMFQKNYDNAQIAISLSHFYAYKQTSDKYDNALIFEDDVINTSYYNEAALHNISSFLQKNEWCEYFQLGYIFVYIFTNRI